VLGRAVFNDRNERVGTIDDIVTALDKSVSYAIVNAGGFVGVFKHDCRDPGRGIELGRRQACLQAAP